MPIMFTVCLKFAGTIVQARKHTGTRRTIGELSGNFTSLIGQILVSLEREQQCFRSCKWFESICRRTMVLQLFTAGNFHFI